MPIPTQHPKEGAEAHLHSPRRQSSYKPVTSSSSQSSSIPGPSSVNSNVNTLLSSMPHTQAFLQRGWSNSTSGYSDPFNQLNSDPLSYIDWGNSTSSTSYNQNTDYPAKSSYNPASTQKNAGNRRIANSDISMPDFILGNTDNSQTMSEVMNFSGGPEEPTANTQGPKVPTNTPTTMSFLDELGIDVNKVGTPGSMSAFSNAYVDILAASQQVHRGVAQSAETNMLPSIDTPPTSEFFTNTHISSEFANSLTHSLLNQPHPLPVHSSATVPLPASEIKSRKENKDNYAGSGEYTPTVERIDVRKLSQPILSNRSKDNSTNNSPPSARTLSGIFSRRSASAGEFGHDLTNLTNFTSSNTGPNPVGIPNTDVCVANNPESVKDAKRPRHFTPASSKAIDDADEPRRGSPRVRLFEEESS